MVVSWEYAKWGGGANRGVNQALRGEKTFRVPGSGLREVRVLREVFIRGELGLKKWARRQGGARATTRGALKGTMT